MTTGAQGGLFVVSLDFELHWGIRDHTTLAASRERLLGARRAVEVLLERFEKRSVHATWATVGMLFAHDRDELMRCVPELRPQYRNEALSAYAELPTLGRDEADDPCHFAGSLVDRIARTPGQELASHTFAHFYCLEAGATPEAFEADLRAARKIGERHGDVLGSLVFPRNQVNESHLAILDRLGVGGYRVNPDHWAYDARDGAGETRARRAARLVDAYLPITGSHTTPRESSARGARPIGASAFLRPFSRRLAPLDRLRVRRLKDEMRRAAREDRIFHLWWHPHNFGTHLGENLAVLEALFDELDVLRRRYGMTSATMAEVRRGVSA